MDSHIVASPICPRYQANGGYPDAPPVEEDGAGLQWAERAAIEAADQWLATAPLTLAAWRDYRFSELNTDTDRVEEERLMAQRLFNRIYAHRIGERIAGVGHSL